MNVLMFFFLISMHDHVDTNKLEFTSFSNKNQTAIEIHLFNTNISSFEVSPSKREQLFTTAA